jgi:hypothetical protein
MNMRNRFHGKRLQKICHRLPENLGIVIGVGFTPKRAPSRVGVRAKERFDEG